MISIPFRWTRVTKALATKLGKGKKFATKTVLHIYGFSINDEQEKLERVCRLVIISKLKEL